MAAPDLRITVTSLSSTAPLGDIRQEIRLTKAALLYADSVTLYSPKIALISAIAGIADSPLAVRHEAMVELLSQQPELALALQSSSGLPQSRTRRVSQELWFPAEILSRQEEYMVARELRLLVSEMDTLIEHLRLDNSYQELRRAVEAGVVDLHPSARSAITLSRPALINLTSALLLNVVGPSAESYPLFDDSTGLIVNEMAGGARLPAGRSSSIAQVRLAARFINQLEAFPDADMSVVLDARRKLAAPLTRFRSALTEMSSDFADTALGPEFGVAADEAYRRDIAPALLELDELAHERRLLVALRNQATGASASALTKAGLALAATTVAGLPDIAKAASAVAVAAADLTSGAATSRRQASQTMRSNKFLWLYEAPRVLGRHE